MNEEISHISQFQELTDRAKNFGLHITYSSDVFTLSIPDKGFDKVGDYKTLADLRAAISDWVADQRTVFGRKF